MTYKLFYKSMSIGIVLLFVGVAVQPTLADEISISNISDVEEDCLECQPVNRVDHLRFKLLLIKLEVFTNIILSRFGQIPEVKEKCDEVLDVIHSNIVLDYPIICGKMENLLNSLSDLFEYLVSILDNHPNNLIIHLIISPIGTTVLVIWWYLSWLGVGLDCWDFELLIS